MRLILARHGNTFGPGDRVVWVGARSDLPLVEKGRAQAAAIGAALKRAGIVPARVVAGPLRRTRETAALIIETAGLAAPVEIDDRLTEIDYGRWEGKSSDEIRSLYPGELEGWEERQAWPAMAGWQPEFAMLKSRLVTFIESVTAATAGDILIVSSNGILRLVGEMLTPGIKSYKMATGTVSFLTLKDGATSDVRWNMKPKEL